MGNFNWNLLTNHFCITKEIIIPIYWIAVRKILLDTFAPYLQLNMWRRATVPAGPRGRMIRSVYLQHLHRPSSVRAVAKRSTILVRRHFNRALAFTTGRPVGPRHPLNYWFIPRFNNVNVKTDRNPFLIVRRRKCTCTTYRVHSIRFHQKILWIKFSYLS